MPGLDLSPRAEEALLQSIPTRGNYAAVRKGHHHTIVWRQGVSEKALIHFVDSPHKAMAMASDLNFVHEDRQTGETIRNWNSLKAAWWDGKLERRIIIPGR